VKLGMLKASLTKTIRGAAGKSLAEAKDCTDLLLEGKSVPVTFQTAADAKNLCVEVQQLEVLARCETRYHLNEASQSPGAAFLFPGHGAGGRRHQSTRAEKLPGRCVSPRHMPGMRKAIASILVSALLACAQQAAPSANRPIRPAPRDVTAGGGPAAPLGTSPQPANSGRTALVVGGVAAVAVVGLIMAIRHHYKRRTARPTQTPPAKDPAGARPSADKN
jgi:hypothetical protein